VPPFANLSQQMWQVTFWVIVMLVIMFGFATIPNGFFMRTTGEALGSTGEVGFFTMDFLGTEYIVSELTMFIIVTVIILGSLGAVGGGLAWLFFYLSQNVAEAKSSPDLAALPAGSAQREIRERTNAQIIARWILALVTFIVLYVLFYYVLIGLVVGAESPMLVPLSFFNALLVTFILFWSELFVRLVGWLSRLLLRILRGIPAFLGQK
jgi:hypothetical protein